MLESDISDARIQVKHSKHEIMALFLLNLVTVQSHEFMAGERGPKAL